MADKPEEHGLVTVSSDVMLQELGDEIILVNLETGVYFALNEVAARTWALLKDASSIDAVVTSLVGEYAVDETTVRTDVDRLLTQLEEHGLMQRNHA